MKTLTITLGIIVLVAALAVPVMAWGPGWGRGGPGPGYCWQFDRGTGNFTPEQRSKLNELDQKFYNETTQLKNEIWAKSNELDGVLDAPKPDTEKAKALQKELNDLRAKMSEKRLEYDLEARKVAPEGGYAQDRGWGYGPRARGGFGPGACWNR